MSSSSDKVEYISLEELNNAVIAYERDPSSATTEVINLLKKFHCFGSESVAGDNRLRISQKAGKLVGGGVSVHGSILRYFGKEEFMKKLSELSGDQLITEAESSGHEKAEIQHISVAGEKINSLDEFKKSIRQEHYAIDVKAIESHLLKFLESVTVEDEGYNTKEIKIYFYKELSDDVQLLIGSGTKVLDAILYVAMLSHPEAAGLFDTIEKTQLTALTIAKNIQEAKRAIQAAAVIVYIQGSLPKNMIDEKKPVPKFLSEYIYKSEELSMTTIGKQLSSANTVKFPARIFLDIDINKFPTPVATRAKLGIAGNKAVRYAVFAGSCSKEELFEVADHMKGPQILAITKKNAKIKLAIEISDFLRSLSGNVAAQLKMHPLAPNRPVVKNLLLKLTRAIIESLTHEGRLNLFEKMTKAKNTSFLSDMNFAGDASSGTRVWRIVDNEEADFMELSVPSLKGIYGLT